MEKQTAFSVLTFYVLSSVGPDLLQVTHSNTLASEYFANSCLNLNILQLSELFLVI